MEKERSLKERFTRVEDMVEIYQLQSTYMHWLCLGRSDEIIQLFATELDDVSVEIADSGVFEGAKGIERVFAPLQERSEKPGEYTERRAINPVVEVAGDGKTAKGVWLSPGIMTSGEQELQCWSWGKYDNVYVKLDREWKIWHLKWYLTFDCRMEKGWMNEQYTPMTSMRIPELFPPDKPTTHHIPFSPHRINILIPLPPEPYETYEG